MHQASYRVMVDINVIVYIRAFTASHDTRFLFVCLFGFVVVVVCLFLGFFF